MLLIKTDLLLKICERLFKARLNKICTYVDRSKGRVLVFLDVDQSKCEHRREADTVDHLSDDQGRDESVPRGITRVEQAPHRASGPVTNTCSIGARRTT